MNYFSIFLSLFIIAGAAYLYRKRKQKADLKIEPSIDIDNKESFTSDTKQGTAWFTEWINQIRGKQKNSPQQFQQWAKGLEPLDTPPVTELKNWLIALDQKEMQKLMKQIELFGSIFDFDIAWLLEQQLDNNVQLKQTLNEAVAFYCLANFKANLVTDEIKAFVALQAWQKNPESKELREFSENLFAHLMEKGLLPPAPSNLYLASEEERQKHAVAVIREVAKQNPEGFNAVLKEVVAPDTEPAPAPQPPPTPVAA